MHVLLFEIKPCINFITYTNGQKKGYTEYMSNYSLVNLKHSMFLT